MVSPRLVEMGFTNLLMRRLLSRGRMDSWSVLTRRVHRIECFILGGLRIFRLICGRGRGCEAMELQVCDFWFFFFSLEFIFMSDAVRNGWYWLLVDNDRTQPVRGTVCYLGVALVLIWISFLCKDFWILGHEANHGFG